MTDNLVWRAALQPLVAALLARAQAEADAMRAAAEEEGREVVAAAREQAAATLAQARVHGEEDAAELRASERARARRAARAVVLRAQRAAYDDLCRLSQDAVGRLLAYPGRRGDLVARVRRRIGDQAVIRDGPDGGVVGSAADGVSVDASVRGLVERAVVDLDLEQLWAPR